MKKYIVNNMCFNVITAALKADVLKTVVKGTFAATTALSLLAAVPMVTDNSVYGGGRSIPAVSDTMSFAEVSAPHPAAPHPTIPGSPTTISDNGGTKKAKTSGPAASGSASYNSYWSSGQSL